MKKIYALVLNLLLVTISLAGFSDRNLANLKLKQEQYNNQLEQIETIKEDLTKTRINSKYGIISSRDEATLNISTIFKYYKTSTYEIFTRPNYTTAIKLNKDEIVVYIGGGNTENWKIDTTKGGTDNSEIIFIKPLFKNLKTNLTIITNKRSYFMYVQSGATKYNPYVEWEYPYEQKMQFIKNDLDGGNVKLKGDINDLDFSYNYKKSSSISPMQVFNDGEKTVLIMNPKLQEMPIVYGYTQDKQLVQVNYRVIENRIFIDKVLQKIQLVLGKEIVEIYQK